MKSYRKLLPVLVAAFMVGMVLVPKKIFGQARANQTEINGEIVCSTCTGPTTQGGVGQSPYVMPSQNPPDVTLYGSMRVDPRAENTYTYISATFTPASFQYSPSSLTASNTFALKLTPAYLHTVTISTKCANLAEQLWIWDGSSFSVTGGITSGLITGTTIQGNIDLTSLTPPVTLTYDIQTTNGLAIGFGNGGACSTGVTVTWR